VPTSSSDIDFYIDVDAASGREMVIVSDTVHTKQHADYLARHIVKLEGIIRDLEAPAAPAAAAVAGALPAPSRPQAAY
ncbi:eukaryotic translation initiation factor 3 subunit L, partial [Haematococcus lacustris]